MPSGPWDLLALSHAVLLLAAFTQQTTAYRILSSANDSVGATPAVFEPYVRGQVGYYGDPANPDPERVNEGSPFSPDQPRIFFQSSPKQNCPGMIGPINDEEYYCRGREYGYCDRRSGLCVCNQGYTGLDCTDCKPSYFKKGSVCLPKKSCPKDCSRAGVCDYETGTCACALNRRGDDCSQRFCSFDAKCTSCTSTQCLSCIEGFYVDPATQTCLSCKAFDPRCLQCTASGCLTCADLILNSVRRSGARLVDAALPFDELTREFSFKFSYGSQDPRVFDEAEAYQLVPATVPALNTASQSCVQGLRRDASWSCQSSAVSHKVCGHAGVFSWASPVYAISEAATNITLTVRRSGGGFGDASVVYDLEHVTTNPSDVSPTMFYTSSQTLSFATGVVELSFSLTIHDDHSVDGDKTFRVRLRTPSDRSALGSQRDALINILDDDLSQTDASLTFVIPPASAGGAALADGGRAGDTLTFQIQAVVGNGVAKTSGGDVLIMESFVADEFSTDSTQWPDPFPFRSKRSGQITDQGNGKYLCSWQRDAVGNYTVAVWLLYAGGLQGDYYEDAWLSGRPSISRIDRHVNFTWGNGPLFPGASDFVAVRWSGRVKPKATGDVTFYVEYDDHVRLWIGDVLLVDRWSAEHDGGGLAQAVMAVDSSVYYSIVLEYRELSGSAGVKLQWSSASVPKEEIPAANLFTAQHIRGSPFERVPITPALGTQPSTSYIEGTLATVAGTPLRVTLYPVDSNGNARVQWDPTTDVYRAVLTVVTDQSLGAFGSKEVACAVAPTTQERRRFSITCVPFFSGIHALDVTINGVRLFGSPFQVSVTPNAMHPTRSLLSGPGLTANRVAGVATTVTLETRDLHGNRIFTGGVNAMAAATGAAPPVLEIRAFHTTRASAIETGVVVDNGDGTYTLSYTPRVVGTYLVHVTQRGVHIHNSPYSVSVVPNDAVGTTSVASGVSAVGVTNVLSSFQVQSRDANSNDVLVGSSPAAAFQVVLEHAVKGNTTGACVDQLNGRYTCTYTPRFVGASRLHVSLVRGATTAAIVGSPFDVQVSAGVALGSFCFAEGAALAASIAGQQTSFRVSIRDRFDNPKANAGAENISVTFTGPAPLTTPVSSTDVALNVAYQSDGVFLVSYTLTRKGQYAISVLVDSVAIKGSPFSMYTSPAVASPVTTTIDLVAPTSDAVSPLTYVAGDPVKALVTTRDAFGNVLDGGGYRFQFSDALAPPWTTAVSVVDQGNALYSVEFTPLVAREHVLRQRLLLPGGLNATYFATPDLSGPAVLRRVETTLSVDFGVEAPPLTTLARTFSVRWQGLLLPSFSERYTFRAEVLGGLLLRIGNTTLLGSLWPEATTDRRQQASLFLVANTPIPIEIWFSKPTHLPNASVRVTWQSLSQPEQALPADRLLTAWAFVNNVPPVQVVPADAHAPSFTATFAAGTTETTGQTLTLLATAGERSVFQVTARDRFGNRRRSGGDRLSVLFPQLPTDVSLAPDVRDLGNATYEISFAPIRSGTFSMVVAATLATVDIHAGTGVESLVRRLRPSLIQQSPFTLRVRANRPLAETSTLVGDGTRVAVAGETASFHVELRDLHGNRVDPTTASSVPLQVVLRRLDGDIMTSYDGIIGATTSDGVAVTYTALASGQYELLLSVARGSLVQKTSSVRVVPNLASALTSTASGAGLGPQVALQTVNTFDVTLRDAFQNQLTRGGNGLALVLRGPAVVYGDAVDQGNGRYTMQYTLTVAGRYELAVTLANPGRGLVGSYFESTRYERPMGLRRSLQWVDARIDFDWRVNQTMRNYPRVQWKGFLVPRFTETYTLQLLADPFGAVYVDGAPIVDLLHMSQTGTRDGQVALVAGRLHRIVVEYRSASSRDVAGGRLQLQWRSARQPQEIIPTDALLPDGQQLQPVYQIQTVT